MQLFILLFLLVASGVTQISQNDARLLYQQRDTERSRLWRAGQYDKAMALLQEMSANPALLAVTEIAGAGSGCAGGRRREWRERIADFELPHYEGR